MNSKIISIEHREPDISRDFKNVIILNQYLCLFLLFLLWFCLPITNALATNSSQFCGDDITWILSDDGVLTLSGTGDTDYFLSQGAPWYEQRNEIVSFVLKGRINGLRGYILEDCPNLESISWGNLGDFQNTRIANCPKLQEIHIPYVNGWSRSSIFTGCDNLTVYLTMNSIQLVPSFRAEHVNYVIEGKTTDFVISDVSGSDGEWRELSYYLGNDSNITVPDGITRISNGCFQYLDTLETVSLPSSIRSIEDSAFSNCSHLTTINLPEGLTKISSFVFSGCSSLETFVIPSTVRRINSYAFSQCSGLKTITIPAATVDIGYGAFSSCTSLSTVIYAGTNEQKTAIVIENNNSLFSNTSWILESPINNWMILPKNVTTIEEEAFAHSGVEAIVVDSNCRTIKPNAFSNCFNLQRLYIPSSVVLLADNFIEKDCEVIIYCEKESAAYKWCRTNEHPYVLGKYQ